MDHISALHEYHQILQDAADWLVQGYRRPRSETPPAAQIMPLPKLEEKKQIPGKGNPAPASPKKVPSRDYSASNLEQIQSAVAGCTACNLHLTRDNTVPGKGPVGATLLVVTPPPVVNAGFGDGPLAPSEAAYLGKWLVALGLRPEQDVFLTPAVKCRTPGGRPPHAEESRACLVHLRHQYKMVKPRAVLALGAAACGVLTGDSADFPSLVGRDWQWGAVPALVLWTPMEVLAHPGRLRRPVWKALQALKAAWNALP